MAEPEVIGLDPITTKGHDQQIEEAPSEYQSDLKDPRLREALEYEYTPEEEKKLVRKFDYHLLSFLFVLYMLSFLDRGNIGNANTAGMSVDIGVSDSQYQWFLTIFYISYIIFEFMIFGYKVLQPRYFVPCVVIAWGVVSSCCAAVHNFQGMMALRFLLGFCEASFGPGVPYFLTFFYYRHEVAWKMAIFLSSAPIASTFSGALAYGITKHKLAIEGWRVLFLVEGLPTILVGFIGFYAIPNGPTTCRFLTPHEKNIAISRLARQTGSVQHSTKINFKEIILSVADLKVWLPMLMYFSINVPFSSLPVFSPAIIEGMGFNSVNAQGLSALPYIYTFFSMLLAAWLSDKYRQRGLAIMVLALEGAAGYLILALCYKEGPRYFALFLSTGGIFPCIALVLAWISNNQTTESKRGIGFVLVQMLGQSGPLVGTRLFPKVEGPHYTKGMWVSFGFCILLCSCALLMRLVVGYENRILDKKYGPVIEGSAELSSNGVNEEGEINPNFRYMY